MTVALGVFVIETGSCATVDTLYRAESFEEIDRVWELLERVYAGGWFVMWDCRTAEHRKLRIHQEVRETGGTQYLVADEDVRR
jgi:hypothetical protein